MYSCASFCSSSCSPWYGFVARMFSILAMPVLAILNIRAIKCTDNDHHTELFLLTHMTGKVFHTALYSLVLERITHVASTSQHRGSLTFRPFKTKSPFAQLRLWVEFLMVR